MTTKKVIGLREEITVFGSNGKHKTVLARIDTGAQKSSIDLTLSSELNLGPIIKTTKIRSASGFSTRPVVEVEIEISGTKLKNEFNIANRSHMKYPVIIGRNALRHNDFLIDPEKSKVVKP